MIVATVASVGAVSDLSTHGLISTASANVGFHLCLQAAHSSTGITFPLAKFQQRFDRTLATLYVAEVGTRWYTDAV